MRFFELALIEQPLELVQPAFLELSEQFLLLVNLAVIELVALAQLSSLK